MSFTTSTFPVTTMSETSNFNLAVTPVIFQDVTSKDNSLKNGKESMNEEPLVKDAEKTNEGPITNKQNENISEVLNKAKLEELVKEVDEYEQLDEDVEEVLLEVTNDFIDKVVASSCKIAKHRLSNTLEASDVLLCLDKCWNMWIPGFSEDEIAPYKMKVPTEEHMKRMSLIRKTLRRY